MVQGGVTKVQKETQPIEVYIKYKEHREAEVREKQETRLYYR